MPREIVTETSRDKSSGRAKKLSGKAEFQIKTCPAPECNLSTKDVKLLLNESKRYMKLFKPAFQSVEQIQKSLIYLHGLRGHATRKNVEQMALGQREKVRSLQYFVGQSQWETEPVIAIHQGLIGETLGKADGVALIDESSAVDGGQVVNPDNVIAQMEGGIVFVLTATLKAEATLKDGRIQQSNFHDYPLLQMSEMPVIDVYIIESDNRPTGIGEMGVPPITPAVANAVYAATGKRIRHIPIRQ